MQQSKFIYSFHGLRGIASLMVLIAHLTGGYHENIFELYASSMQSKISHFGTFGVEIFFMLSGFVVAQSLQTSDIKSFVKKRFWRLYPVFILLTLLFFLVNSLTNISPEKNHLEFLLINALFLELFLNTPSLTPNAWSLTYEVWYYATLGMFSYFLGTPKRFIYLLLPILLLAYFLTIFPITFYFVLGVCLYLMTRSHELNTASPIWVNVIQIISLVLVCCLLINGVEFASQGYKSIFSNPAEIVLPFILWIFLGTLLFENSIVSKILGTRFFAYLGTISYSLYLFHPYTYRVSRELVEMVFDSDSWLGFLTFLASSIFISIKGAEFLYKKFEEKIYVKVIKKKIYMG